MNHPQFEIAVQDMGGWVRVFLAKGQPPGDIAVVLSHSLANWFRQKTNYQIRFAIPINREGNTVEVHAWYDQTRFPDASGMGSPPGPGPISGSPSVN